MADTLKYHVNLTERKSIMDIPTLKTQLTSANERFALLEMALVIAGTIKGIVAKDEELPTDGTNGDVWLVRDPQPGKYVRWDGSEWAEFETWMTADALLPDNDTVINEIQNVLDLNSVPLPLGLVGGTYIEIQEVLA